MGLVKGEPVVGYRETVTKESRMMMLSKSPNKHNRIFCKAEPMEEGIAEDIDEGCLKQTDDPKTKAKFFTEKYNWDKSAALKIWSFGPDGMGPNMVVDDTKGVQYLNEICCWCCWWCWCCSCCSCCWWCCWCPM